METIGYHEYDPSSVAGFCGGEDMAHVSRREPRFRRAAWRRIGLGLVVGAVFAAGCATVGEHYVEGNTVEESAMPTDLSPQASAGFETFSTVGCSACHGPVGEGGVGPALAGHTEDQLFRQVRVPKGDIMPPFSVEVLSDDDIRDIYAWIVTLGEEMAMAPHEPEGGQAGSEREVGAGDLTPTEIAHLRLTLLSIEAENADDAIRHVNHLALHGGDATLLELVSQMEVDLEAGKLHDVEAKALEILGPAAEGDFDVVAAHVGMALSASQRDGEQDVDFHLVQAAEAAAGHDHETVIRQLLDDWRGGENRHDVVDALYDALGLEHPPH